MNGYILESFGGNYLTHNLWWYPHPKRDAYVFSENEIAGIRKIIASGEWGGELPYWITPAKYDEENNEMIIIGNPITF